MRTALITRIYNIHPPIAFVDRKRSNKHLSLFGYLFRKSARLLIVYCSRVVSERSLFNEWRVEPRLDYHTFLVNKANMDKSGVSKLIERGTTYRNYITRT